MEYIPRMRFFTIGAFSLWEASPGRPRRGSESPVSAYSRSSTGSLGIPVALAMVSIAVCGFIYLCGEPVGKLFEFPGLAVVVFFAGSCSSETLTTNHDAMSRGDARNEFEQSISAGLLLSSTDSRDSLSLVADGQTR